MRKFTLLLLVTGLMVQYVNAQVERRNLRWRDQNGATNVYNIKNTNNANTFLNPNNWRVVDNLGNVTTEVAAPRSNDILQIYDASLTLDVDFDMSALENIVLDFGNAKPGTPYSLLLREGAAWILHETTRINVRGGELRAEIDNVGLVDTWIQIGSVVKLLAFNNVVAAVYAPSQSSNSTPQSTTPAQEGFTAGLLPVLFSSFDAVRESSGVNISWKTRQETESKLFYVERSNDGRNYTPITSLPAAGSSSTVRSYSFTDATAINGVAYYRVRIVSNDNLSGFTPVKAVRSMAAARRLSLYPNPATTTVQLIIPNSQSEAFMVSLYNESGQLVMNRSVSSDGNMLTLDVSRLAPGNYHAEARFASGTRYQSRFMIKR